MSSCQSTSNNKFNGLPQEQKTRNLSNAGCLFESSCSVRKKKLSIKINYLMRNHERKRYSIGNVPCFLVNILGQEKMHVVNFACVRIVMLPQVKMMIVIHKLIGVPLDRDE